MPEKLPSQKALKAVTLIAIELKKLGYENPEMELTCVKGSFRIDLISVEGVRAGVVLEEDGEFPGRLPINAAEAEEYAADIDSDLQDFLRDFDET